MLCLFQPILNFFFHVQLVTQLVTSLYITIKANPNTIIPINLRTFIPILYHLLSYIISDTLYRCLSFSSCFFDSFHPLPACMYTVTLEWCSTLIGLQLEGAGQRLKLHKIFFYLLLKRCLSFEYIYNILHIIKVHMISRTNAATPCIKNLLF